MVRLVLKIHGLTSDRLWVARTLPQMVVFGDSNSDTGRRYNAPASFQFEEYGIGPFPFKRLYDGTGTDVSYFLPQARADNRAKRRVPIPRRKLFTIGRMPNEVGRGLSGNVLCSARNVWTVVLAKEGILADGLSRWP